MLHTLRLHFLLIVFGFFFITDNLYAQNTTIDHSPWKDLSLHYKTKFKPDILTKKSRKLQLDLKTFSRKLQKIPNLQRNSLKSDGVILSFPLPDGSFARFKVLESPVMAPELANKYPSIKTYLGQGLDDPTMTIRFDLTHKGFHAIIISPENTVYIDPVSTTDKTHYISYNKRDFIKRSDVLFDELPPIKQNEASLSQSRNSKKGAASKASGAELRTYRIAIAATGEYTAFHGGSVSDGLAAIATTLNRVNGIYEREVSISMVLVANNDQIIYTDSNTDPYTNNSSITLLNENQTNIDNIIGSANYDIGHVFSTASGGVAQFRSVCRNGFKARGTTGVFAPIGDPFDVDYVAHEIGHQFGGSHTFNGSSGNCSGGNHSSTTAYEPGSGTTIMAYAGICFPQNIQSNSNDYFHTISYEEIVAYSTEDNGNNCPVVTLTGNQAPVVDAGTGGFTIPISTPFELTGSATDPDGDPLTYCWEQFDLGPTGHPDSPSGTAPLFRSFSPSTSSTRVFPKLTDILGNTQTKGEILPDYAREMNFRLTVRDNKAGGGGVDFDLITFNVSDLAGPFVVTGPDPNVKLTAGTSMNVTWNVADTDKAPINTTSVDILLSLDGGLTFPIILAQNVSNDGLETITVPDNPTTNGRIKIKAVGNVFFDISDEDLIIETSSIPDFSINVTPQTNADCAPINLTFNVSTESILGYNSPINLSVSNLPAGMTASFDNSTVNPGETSTLTITGATVSEIGESMITIHSESNGNTKTNNVTIGLYNSLSDRPTLSTPTNDATQVSVKPTLNWQAVSGADHYTLEIATDNSFTAITQNITDLESTSYIIEDRLQGGTVYFWRVKAHNFCGEADYSSVFSFKTEPVNFFVFESTDVPVSISPSSSNTITSTIEITESFTINDVNVIDLKGKHTFVSDLTISLISPSNKKVVLFDGICESNDDFHISLDDEAASSVILCPPTDENTYQPLGSLSSFDEENSKGTWTLEIKDNATEDGGSLDGWGLELATLDARPQTPGELTAEVISYSQINLAWADNSNNEDQFVVEMTDEEENFSVLDFLEPNITTYQAVDLKEKTTYTFRIRTKNINGVSDPSNEVKATTLVLGIEEIKKNDLRVYPNPSTGDFKIEVRNPENKISKISINDITGRTVFEQLIKDHTQSFTINVNGKQFERGVYMITLKAHKHTIVKKLIKR